MFSHYANHNQFKFDVNDFYTKDPHLYMLSKLSYQHSADWFNPLLFQVPGIYILTGGRQVGKSTSCKLLIKQYLKKQLIAPEYILYLPCDEIYDATEFSRILRLFLDSVGNHAFLLIIDEVTYVKRWDRVIKSLADEGYFTRGLCVLTGSDSLILKEAAMSFPGRRGVASQTDFHLYPLTFQEYVNLIGIKSENDLTQLFQNYLQCGGYLRAINDLAQNGQITEATYLTYEQWIRGDFLKHDKRESYLLALLNVVCALGVSPISFSALTQKIGLMSKDTCIDYLMLLERMDVLIDLQAYDQNKKQGFPRKDRKIHFFDPFIQQTIYRWLLREGYQYTFDIEPCLVEACVASHCYRYGKTFYFKGQGEIDIIWLHKKNIYPIEVKWAKQLRPYDLKMLKQFKNSIILGKTNQMGEVEQIKILPVYSFLYNNLT